MREIYEDVREEAFLQCGHVCRERNDGRIDCEVGFAAPFNASSIIANPFLMDLLPRALGEEFQLKSMHVLLALTHGEGNRDQHWHRDTGALFDDDNSFFLRDVHGTHGRDLALPPFALNVFVPLFDMKPVHGPTEFVLGSHKWGGTWSDWEDPRDVEVAPVYETLGSYTIADYRTVHRGTTNRHASEARPVLMMIYGRDWWQDVVNYGSGNDYGGISADVSAIHSAAASQIDPSLPDRATHSLKQLLVRQFPHRSQPGLGFPQDPRDVPSDIARQRMLLGMLFKWEKNLYSEIGRELRSQHARSEL